MTDINDFAGTHPIPFSLERENLKASLDQHGNRVLYHRECCGEEFDRVLFSSAKNFIINPVEPVNLPERVTHFLLVMFSKPLMVEPRNDSIIHIMFPIEWGVFVSSRKVQGLLDMFTLTSPKYTLYGPPRKGIVCKYFNSEAYREIPGIDPFREGVMELRIINESGRWVELKKVVFHAEGMKLYYGEGLVGMKAKMVIDNKTTAVTEFSDQPLKKGMKKAVELYTGHKIKVTAPKFIMDEGL